MFYHVFQCLSIVIEQKGMNPVLPREILMPQIYKKKLILLFFSEKKINIYSYSTSYGKKMSKGTTKEVNHSLWLERDSMECHKRVLLFVFSQSRYDEFM